MQIVSLIIIGIGLLIAYGGVVGIRSGKMQKIQFGGSIGQSPTTLEGDAARRQGIGYIVAGVVMVVVGVLINTGNPAALFLLVGVFSLISAVYLAYVGWQGIQKRDVVYTLTIQSRSVRNRIRTQRLISHHYAGTPAVVVGIGYLVMAAGFFILGLIALFQITLLVAGVVFALITCGLWVLSDFIAGRMSAGVGSDPPR